MIIDALEFDRARMGRKLDAAETRRLQLEKVIDGLQDRFGSHTIARGRSAVSSRERKS